MDKVAFKIKWLLNRGDHKDKFDIYISWIILNWVILKIKYFDFRKSPTGQDFAENVKQKVWLRVGLDDVEVVKSKKK